MANPVSVHLPIRQKLKSIAIASGLHRFYAVITLYLRMRHAKEDFRHWSDEDQRRYDFYRQFISPKDLVFDIGANLGNRCKSFAKLGATVVAVEPQPLCADFLASVFEGVSNFHLERKAMGEKSGKAEMLISDAHTISSMSKDWVKSVTESGRFPNHNWDKRAEVSVETLDHLVEKYGRPVFIKIDVEGFEGHVLAGLSTPVRCLSFEFTSEFLGDAIGCVERMAAMGGAEFQLSLGETMLLELPSWIGAAEIREALGNLLPGTFGDVYVRFPRLQQV